jgi:hypothetical protein
MYYLTLIIVLLFLVPQAHAKGVGVGLMLGETTGVTAKSPQGDTALDAGLGWSVGGSNPLQLHGDHLWIVPGAMYYKESTALDLHFGIGGRMKFDDEINLGARFPIGLSSQLGEGRSEFFGEVAPIIDILPDLDVEGHVMVGVRFYL